MDQSGFNKVEVLVLVVIVITLIMVFINFTFDIQEIARDAKRHGDIDEIAKELEVHFNNQPNQFCPDSEIDTYCAPQASWFDKNLIPTDPLTQQAYLNLPTDGSKNFYICAKLENGDQYCVGGQQ